MQEEILTFSDDAASKDRQFVNALARGLEILRCFRPGEVYLTNTELARRTGMPKPTITRLTYTLTKLGYLNYAADQGKYQLGSGVLALGYSLLSNLDIRKLSRPSMQELAEHSQCNVALGIRDRLSMVYIEACRGSGAVTLRREVGSRIPLAATAMGKALLCGLPQAERDFLLDHIRLRDEEKWPKIKAGIEQGYKDFQDFGFCVSVGEWESSIHAVGVPLIDPDGEKMMAYNCGGPAFMLTLDALMNDLGPRLVALVRKVEVSMGRH
ncbi:IclR family transcriptional regulator [Herbaspirillum sp. RTI4]|uniref:IclR family transcriptional regulator n=1 Tax=Herbaspirillum sp. RTI4 TaxID=3048640 RepID=UPI002AB446AB|nr:IclR family transcriptional regulator [Herbaspirillum sp. RTI4]MDY7577091.1 IclR family transcriptional regulator [Herbaspirillum sp. RTI4]MEA9982271.1 IclR family transcriptional regulator [Herbaspirillum sp. RTI4]